MCLIQIRLILCVTPTNPLSDSHAWLRLRPFNIPLSKGSYCILIYAWPLYRRTYPASIGFKKTAIQEANVTFDNSVHLIGSGSKSQRREWAYQKRGSSD
jgi:hypothetical protein